MESDETRYKPSENAPVEIPEILIKRLREAGLSTRRFLKVEAHSKAAVEKNWPNRLFEPEELKGNKGNYGVSAGEGLVLVDGDEEPLVSRLQTLLPATFRVHSPGHETPHYYLKVTGDPENLALFWGKDEDGQPKNIGHVQAKHKYLVGPGCFHPNGSRYTVLNDAPIAEIAWTDLKQIVTPFLRESQRTMAEAASQERKHAGNLNLNIANILPLGLTSQGDELYGIHPVHGSTTGHNFWVNVKDGVWYCFRCCSGGGAWSLLAVLEKVINCADARPGALRGDLFKQTLQKAVDRGLIKQLPKKNEAPVSIPHLNMVEDPQHAGKPLIVEAVVASTSLAYLAPKEVEATVEGEDGDETTHKATFNGDDPLNIKFVGVNEDVKYRREKRIFGDPSKVRIREKAWRTIYLIRVRPPVYTLEKRGEAIVDERGFEYKAFDAYVAADQPLTFQASALVRLEAKPLGSPKTQKTVLLASRVEFPEETWRFDEAKLRLLKAKLDSLGSVKAKAAWILDNFERFSGLVGRRNLAFGGFLAFFSSVWVVLDGEVQRGWIVALFMGDTTTGKSETLRKLIMLLKGGLLITAETASQVGLTGTATQLEKEGWFVDWGFLVLCDRKLLAIDGVHKLPFSCWAALAEAERAGVVTIAKAAKNSAYARTRQIKIANPLDREAEKWTTKPLADFLCPCQALPSVLDKTGIARLDLAVFADSRDVKPEEVNIQMDEHPDPDLELLSEALKWCWSGTAKIEFTEDTIKEILKSATDLYNTFYTQSIPLVSMDMKWKIARLSAALAYLTLSTEDFATVKVTDEHVREVVEFLREEYGKTGLNTLAQEDHYEVLITKDAERIIQAIATQASMERDTLEDILKFIVLHGRVTRDQLKTQFSIPEHPQLRALLASLQNSKLIRASRGFYPTPQLVQLYKVLVSSSLSTLSRSEKDPPKNSGDGEDGNDG